MKRFPLIRKIVGILFILLGLLALFTPLTPGSWLAIVGLELIGIRLAFIEKIKAYLARMRPKQKSGVQEDVQKNAAAGLESQDGNGPGRL